ncbi:MAG: DUF58 domain-containing protein [Anaerolineales bacterium]
MDPKRWFPLLALLFLFGLFFRIDWVMSLAIAVAVVIGLAWWWRGRALDSIRYIRKFHYTRGFPGEKTEVRIEVENHKLLPLSWLRIQDPWPKNVGPIDPELLAPSHIHDQGLLTNVFSLRWFERARRKFEIQFAKRGVYQIGPAEMMSGDLFGIFEDKKEATATQLLTVFPKTIRKSEMEIPAEDPLGDRRSRRRLFEDPNRPMGVREYHPEDSFRRVHWPATARTGKLQVKIFQPTSGQVMVVCLNVSTFARSWEGVYPPMLEYLVSTAATLCNDGILNGYKVGLIANGCIAKSDQPFRIPPGRSPRQLATLLSALAGVNPVVTAPFERFLMREVPRIPYGASLVIVTAVISDTLAETLVKIKKHERKITLLSLAVDPPDSVPGIHVMHAPFDETLVEDLV